MGADLVPPRLSLPLEAALPFGRLARVRRRVRGKSHVGEGRRAPEGGTGRERSGVGHLS